MNGMNGMQRRVRLMLAGLILGAGAVSPLAAAQLVTFTRGQSIVVDNVERREDWYYFTLEGGGEMGVPARLVARVENYEAPPPAVAAASAYAPPSPAASAPAATPTPANTPPGQAPAAPAAGPATPSATPGSANPAVPNVMSQSDDWRYKVRMSGGPRQVGPMDRTGGGRQGMGGNRVPAGGGPGGRRNQQPTAPVPPQQ